MKNILVVAAHPDDEVLGCGGTIARYARDGHRVSILILGEGITSREEARRRVKKAGEIRRLKQQAGKASRILGAQDITLLDLPDNRFDTRALLDIVKLVERRLAEVKPDIIFTHSNADLNIDHVITHRAVLTATRPFPGQTVKELYAFEVPSSTEWSFSRFEHAFRPDTFISIEGTLSLKLQALALYEGELRKFPHPRSAQAVTLLARNRGSMVGVNEAEAFELVRRIIPDSDEPREAGQGRNSKETVLRHR